MYKCYENLMPFLAVIAGLSRSQFRRKLRFGLKSSHCWSSGQRTRSRASRSHLRNAIFNGVERKAPSCQLQSGMHSEKTDTSFSIHQTENPQRQQYMVSDSTRIGPQQRLSHWDKLYTGKSKNKIH